MNLLPLDSLALVMFGEVCFSNKHDLGLADGLGCNHIATHLLQVEQIDGATVTDTADVDVVVAVLVVDRGRLVLQVVLL